MIESKKCPTKKDRPDCCAFGCSIVKEMFKRTNRNKMSKFVEVLKSLEGDELKAFINDAKLITDDLSIELIKRACEPEKVKM